MNAAHRRVLAKLGVAESDLIGAGGEYLVYGLSPDRILRLRRTPGPGAPGAAALRDFLGRIEGRLPFATPLIVEIGPGEVYTIEKRLPGRAMSKVLTEIGGEARQTAWLNYLAAVEAFGDIVFSDRPYGHLLAATPITAGDWPGFARRSLERFAATNRATIARAAGDPDRLRAKALELAAGLEPLPPKALVHGDYLPGNVLLDDQLAVSAVVDFGVFTVVGDPLLDLAVAYLSLEMIEECTSADTAFVRAALAERHGSRITAAMRFYRAYLAFSMADPANAAAPYPKLYGWSIAMLRRLASDDLPA